MNRLSVVLALMPSVALAEAPAPQVPIFAEETATAGVTQTYGGEWEYMAGGGAATLDTTVATSIAHLTAAEALGHREFVMTRLYESA